MTERDQISAGGVAFRKVDGGIEVALIQTVSEMRWQLPKGIIDPGETAEETALREVREEAGIVCEPLGPLGETYYQFIDHRGGSATKINKTVHFFLMRYLSGDVRDHDDEVADARWVHSSLALEQLFFDSERDILSGALSRISALGLS
ncbi:MAG TPA: NUDIX hydrolase [Pyrinomonadaceae bacterium]|nr:NUDIX hydrolase [Pyrinomonadaceae bacterium]HMP65068.1 NUDIX hydrolase [Pyrinomonadaceae bacterium]